MTAMADIDEYMGSPRMASGTSHRREPSQTEKNTSVRPGSNLEERGPSRPCAVGHCTHSVPEAFAICMWCQRTYEAVRDIRGQHDTSGAADMGQSDASFERAMELAGLS